MNSERGIFGGDSPIVDRYTARALGFNNDGLTSTGFVPREIGTGEIYHGVIWSDKNIVVASAVLHGETEPSLYLRVFDGMQPTDMDHIKDAKERERLYAEWNAKVFGICSPEFKVTPEVLRERLRELAEE